MTRRDQSWQRGRWDDKTDLETSDQPLDEQDALDEALAIPDPSPTRSSPRRHNRPRQRRAPSKSSMPADDDDEADDEERGPRARPAVRRRRPGEPEEFRCRHCRQYVVSVPSGSRHRNHCPYCLHSRHVDERMPGDRLSSCGATMAPIGMFVRAGGEYALVHRCMDCGVVRHNRIAADDDFDLVLRLPDLTDALPAPGMSALEAVE